MTNARIDHLSLATDSADAFSGAEQASVLEEVAALRSMASELEAAIADPTNLRDRASRIVMRHHCVGLHSDRVLRVAQSPLGEVVPQAEQRALAAELLARRTVVKHLYDTIDSIIEPASDESLSGRILADLSLVPHAQEASDEDVPSEADLRLLLSGTHLTSEQIDRAFAKVKADAPRAFTLADVEVAGSALDSEFARDNSVPDYEMPYRITADHRRTAESVLGAVAKPSRIPVTLEQAVAAASMIGTKEATDADLLDQVQYALSSFLNSDKAERDEHILALAQSAADANPAIDPDRLHDAIRHLATIIAL